jgi:hypothetical protein
MQVSLLALAAALPGTVLERMGGRDTVPLHYRDRTHHGTVIIAIISFLLFLKERFLSSGRDEVAWNARK